MLMMGLKGLIVLEGVRVSELITEDVFSLPVLGEEKIFLNKSERKKKLKRDGPLLRDGPFYFWRGVSVGAFLEKCCFFVAKYQACSRLQDSREL